MENINGGDNVLVIWNKDDEKSISQLVENIKGIVQNGSVVLENSEMITESSRPHSTYNVIISNWLSPYTVKHTDSLLALIVKLLKPSGKLLLKDETDLTSALKLNGFVNVVKAQDNLYIAEKSKFEVGSKASLKFNNKAAVWKLDDTVEAAWAADKDDDLIDDSQLLDENDLKKPDQQSLRVCATTGKRKACADCTCGLAEELRGEVKDTPKSSCGSGRNDCCVPEDDSPAAAWSCAVWFPIHLYQCYLGDAFRCATCPYLGMPAFKPGEKVLLELKSDI